MKIVSTKDAPEAIGPYSQGVVSGNTVYCSGQLPVNPDNGEIAGPVNPSSQLSTPQSMLCCLVY